MDPLASWVGKSPATVDNIFDDYYDVLQFRDTIEERHYGDETSTAASESQALFAGPDLIKANTFSSPEDDHSLFPRKDPVRKSLVEARSPSEGILTGNSTFQCPRVLSMLEGLS